MGRWLQRVLPHMTHNEVIGALAILVLATSDSMER